MQKCNAAWRRIVQSCFILSGHHVCLQHHQGIADILPRAILLRKFKSFKYYGKYYKYYLFYFYFNINSYRVISKFNRSSRGQSRFLGSMPYWTPRAFLSVNSTVPLISSIFKKNGEDNKYNF